jgi:hypothetical protein
MNARHWIVLALLAGLLAASAAAAAEDQVANPWSMGARGGYLYVPDGILGMFYSKHTHINSGFAGLYGAYRFPTFEVAVGVDYYPISMNDGKWLKRGDNEDQTDYVKAKLGMVDLDVSVTGHWAIHRFVDYRLGAGLGFGFLFGPYHSWDVIGGVRQPKESSPSKPPVIPILTVQTGFSFYFVPKRFAFNLDFGFRDGVFGSGGLQGWF